jgi:hypothetical protein
MGKSVLGRLIEDFRSVGTPTTWLSNGRVNLHYKG